MKINQAMILAAGLGNRMQPLTADRPKPMVEVQGKPIIDYAIDTLHACGITDITANTHYKADVLEPHLTAKGIKISHEDVLLDTGGGIKNALKKLDSTQPLLVLSGDSILVGNDGVKSLIDAWDEKTMDILLLLQPLQTMIITPGVGDYDIVGTKPARSKLQTGQYMWTSARVLNPQILVDMPDTPFSFLPLMDAAQNAGRLRAVVHTGIWHHLTTPNDVDRVNAS